MDLVLVAALAFGLGLLAGLAAGAARAFALAARRRAIAGTSGALARIWPDSLPQRSAADILAGRIRVILGGATYDLPVLPRRAGREWIATLDARFAGLAAALSNAEAPEILRMLAAETDALYDVLLTYDAGGVLPRRDSPEDFATEAEILRAVLEVWAALHPLAVSLVAASESPTSGRSAGSTSSSRPSTAGAPTTSPSA